MIYNSMFIFLNFFFISLGIFFLFLVMSLSGIIPLTERVAKLIVAFSCFFWILGIPVSLVVALFIMAGGGHPGGTLFGALAMIFSMLFVAFSLYSLTNIGLQYKLKNYKKLIFITLTPFVDIAIISGMLFLSGGF